MGIGTHWRGFGAALSCGAAAVFVLASVAVEPAYAQPAVGSPCGSAGNMGNVVKNPSGGGVICSTQLGVLGPSLALAAVNTFIFGPPKINGPIDAPGWADSVVGKLINLDSGADDPYFGASSTHDRGAGITSASGTITGSAQSSRITDIYGGVDGHFSGSHVFQLTAYQRLTIGGFFDYDSQRISYGSPTAVAASSSANRNIYTLGGMARYDAGNTYFGVGVGGEVGNGDLNGIAGTTGNGSFDSRGYAAAGYVGHVFSLINTIGSSYAPSSMPTKAPPRPVGGYALSLDLSAHLSYADDDIGGFTDTTGFVRGDERIKFWDVGGQGKLIWTLAPYGRVIWSPFVAATIDQEFGFSHTLGIPIQAGLAADTVFYGSAQIFGGAQLGVDALDISGIRFGIRGYYQQSQEFQVLGGQAYIKFPVLAWLGLQPVMLRNY